jgi:hypothetical protein
MQINFQTLMLSWMTALALAWIVVAWKEPTKPNPAYMVTHDASELTEMAAREH